MRARIMDDLPRHLGRNSDTKTESESREVLSLGNSVDRSTTLEQRPILLQGARIKRGMNAAEVRERERAFGV